MSNFFKWVALTATIGSILVIRLASFVKIKFTDMQLSQPCEIHMHNVVYYVPVPVVCFFNQSKY